jgi:hypothetical protein
VETLKQTRVLFPKKENGHGTKKKAMLAVKV